MSPKEELDALEVRKDELQAVIKAKPPAFPSMVYKDLEGDGDVSSPSNQHTVKDQRELDVFLADGWSQDPNDASSKKADNPDAATPKPKLPVVNLSIPDAARAVKVAEARPKSAERDEAIRVAELAEDKAEAAREDRAEDKTFSQKLKDAAKNIRKR